MYTKRSRLIGVQKNKWRCVKLKENSRSPNLNMKRRIILTIVAHRYQTIKMPVVNESRRIWSDRQNVRNRKFRTNKRRMA